MDITAGMGWGYSREILGGPYAVYAQNLLFIELEQWVPKRVWVYVEMYGSN